MKKGLFCAVLVGASVFALWPRAAQAGGGWGGGGPCAGFAEGATLVMHDSCFDGVAHFASPGETLVVKNRGGAPHSFTAVDGSFDTGLLSSGATAEIPLAAEGVYRVYCTLHGTLQGEGMAGVLIVGDHTPGAQAAGARPLTTAALGSLGAVLGGGALAVVLRRKKLAAPATP